jgi:hypothetical protein
VCALTVVTTGITQRSLFPVSSQLECDAWSVGVWHVIDDVHVCMCRGVGRD